jgi:hypothetical protein
VISNRGVLYLAVGDAYAQLARQSIQSLRNAGYRGRISVLADRPLGRADVEVIGVTADASRTIKTRLHAYSPFELTLYLDCDTLILWPIDDIWNALGDATIAFARDVHPTVGEAVAYAPIEKRGTPIEHRLTLQACGPTAPNFNGGVSLWRRSSQSDQFWEAWHAEWKRFGGVDQFALVRTIARLRAMIATLSPRFNSFAGRMDDAAQAVQLGVSILHFCPNAQQKRIGDFIQQLHFDVRPVSSRANFRGTHFD